MPAEADQQLKSARLELESVCKALESPDPATLDRCAAIMQRLVLELGARQAPALLPPCAADVAEARRLRTVIRRARSLLNLAADYHFRWRRILAAMSGGYTVRGVPPPMHAQSRLLIQG